jgi:hypothetical protein
MCAADRVGSGADGPGLGFGSVMEALRAGRAMVDYLNTPAGHDLDGAACGEALMAIGAIQSGLGAGADTRVDVEIPLSALRGMDGASLVEEAWLRARAGQHGYLAGKDAEVIACDALIVPVVTGSPDWQIVAQMISLVLDYHARHGGTGQPPAQQGEPAQPDDPVQPAQPAQPAQPGEPVQLLQSLPPQAQEELLYAMARLAIDFVSGPGGIASALRRSLLGAQLNGKSVPLDAGHSEHIPAAIRHAVIQRDKHCAWPAGCDRPAAVSDVHHIKHKKDGGPTSVRDCMLLCQYHHDICIHRWGWKIELLPDGSVRATGPQGQIIQSHPPPTSPTGEHAPTDPPAPPRPTIAPATGNHHTDRGRQHARTPRSATAAWSNVANSRGASSQAGERRAVLFGSTAADTPRAVPRRPRPRVS